MSRPLRIEHSNAWYYIQNFARSGQSLFRSSADYQIFLDLLKDTAQRFNVEVHSYALLEPQYHLLIKTKEANLGLAMRHLNGLYTQTFNRQHALDGSLFKGRYKSTLLDPSDYPLIISRHIHREALSHIEDKNLALYSSYAAYIGQSKAASWLHCDALLVGKGKARNFANYKRSMADTAPAPELPKNGFFPALLGRREFIETFRSQITQCAPEMSDAKKVFPKPQAREVMIAVSEFFTQPQEELLRTRRGARADNRARHAAMLLCQSCANMPLKDIAELFGLKHYASASNQISALKKEMHDKPELKKRIDQLSSHLMLEAKSA